MSRSEIDEEEQLIGFIQVTRPWAIPWNLSTEKLLLTVVQL